MPVIQLELDSNGAISSLQKFDNAVDQTEVKTDTAFSKIRGGVVAFAKVAAVALAAAGAAIVAFGLKALDAASRMEEAQNKYNVVFDGMIEKSNEWTSELRKNYALSELAAKTYLSGMKAVLDGTRMETQAAGELSNQLVKTALDLASFHDKAPEDAVRAMTSAVTGEYEAMKQFGIVLKKSEITQEAMRLNTLKTKDAVTDAMMAQAAYSLILQKSGKAVGDTIRSQESYAFQLKQTKSLFEDLKVALGQKLLPIATKWLTVMNDWIVKNDAINRAVNATIEVVRFLDNGIRGLMLVAKGATIVLAGGFHLIASAVSSVLSPMRLLLDGMVKLGVIDTNPLRDMVSFTGDFLQAQIDGFKVTWEGIERSNQMYDALKNKVVENTTEVKNQTVAQTAATTAVEETTESLTEAATAADIVAEAALKASTEVAMVKPAEDALKTSIDGVTSSANQSTAALNAQASAVAKVGANLAAWNQAADAEAAISGVSAYQGGNQFRWNPDTNSWEGPPGGGSSSNSSVVQNNYFQTELSTSQVDNITQDQLRRDSRL